MEQRQLPHSPGCSLDVRDLESHPDYEREIREIKIIWNVSFGKTEPAGMSILRRVIAVEGVGVAQSEHGMHKRPRKDNCAEGEKQMSSEMAAEFGFVDSDQKTDRKERRASRDHDENKDEEPAEVLFSRTRPQFVNRRGEDRHPCEQEQAKSECIPGRNRFGRRMNATA